MAGHFEVRGWFYRMGSYRCRKYLDIRRSDVNVSAPDLMAVMMNPGSAGPADGDVDDSEKVMAPDATQRQLIRVMNACKFTYARLLNLSDLRESKSTRLFATVRELDAGRLPHSIFDPARRSDYESLFVHGVPVIYAWGVDRRLEALARRAMSLIDNPGAIGMQKPGTAYAFYHPLPPVRARQNAWVNAISERLQS